jgi:cell division transport system ATP-binding protein
MIKFEDISKEYNDLVALSNINLEVKEGEFLFLVGPSGAGKTTLIKLLIREELPTAGEIYYDSLEVSQLPRKELPQLRREIGVVFQDFKLLPRKTALENVRFVLDVVGKPPEEQEELAPEILKLVELEKQQDHFPYQLSGGEKQRLAIARALAAEPKVLVADEPTGMIDPAAAWNVLNLLRKINEMGSTVIMATHNAAVVDTLKQRVVELDKGKIVRDQKEGEYAA